MFTTIAYGVPYFERLPGGMAGTLVAGHMPRLIAEPQAYAFEEAVPGPTDVSPLNPEVSKQRFNVPVQIESNDMLVTLRSDTTGVIDEVLAWLSGESPTLGRRRTSVTSGLGELLTVTSRRLMFTQIGLPRKIADRTGPALRGNGQPGVADVDGLLLPAGRQQRHRRRSPRSSATAPLEAHERAPR